MPSTGYLILGAGPTGLGAAWRLHERGSTDWMLLERESYPGGLAASFTDEAGFTWDVGGHVQFSHYHYFDGVMADLLPPEGWCRHQRRSSIRLGDRLIPYPLQNHLHHLPAAVRERCEEDLRRAWANPEESATDFRSWLIRQFGESLAHLFFIPYNEKVWAWPPERLNALWMRNRVAPVDPNRLGGTDGSARDDARWGPNATFAFPARGGTGAIWRACADRLPGERLGFSRTVRRIDPDRREVALADGTIWSYRRLLTTLPLPVLLDLMGWTRDAREARDKLLHSSTHVFGIGLSGTPPPSLRGQNWIYFPGDNCPFYRVTLFSDYSPSLVPDPDRYWSLLVEVASSAYRPENPQTLRGRVLDGLRANGFIGERSPIVTIWSTTAPYGYPTPSLGRDGFLEALHPRLEELGIASRGRFGGWKYEVSNQDHSFMQGIEWVDRQEGGPPERTYFSPDQINRPGKV